MIADLCLVLLLDGSSAISDADWQLQAQATAAAIRNPDVVGRMTGGPNGTTAVYVAEWGRSVAIASHWTAIKGQADAQRSAGQLENHVRYTGGMADLRYALDRAHDAFQQASSLGIECESKVVDVSGGGDSAVSGDAYMEIAKLREIKAQVNAIVVGGQVAIRDFYRDTVPGFVAWATWDIYAQAIQAKIMTEIGRFAEAVPEYRAVAYIPVYGATRWGFPSSPVIELSQAPVDEPRGLALLGLGVLALAAWRAK
jgi:hypothetical protein